MMLSLCFTVSSSRRVGEIYFRNNSSFVSSRLVRVGRFADMLGQELATRATRKSSNIPGTRHEDVPKSHLYRLIIFHGNSRVQRGTISRTGKKYPFTIYLENRLGPFVGLFAVCVCRSVCVCLSSFSRRISDTFLFTSSLPDDDDDNNEVLFWISFSGAVI